MTDERLHNVYEDRARWEKVAKLAAHLAWTHCPAEIAANFTESTWSATASKIGVGEPSARTKKLVVDVLRAEESTR